MRLKRGDEHSQRLHGQQLQQLKAVMQAEVYVQEQNVGLQSRNLLTSLGDGAAVTNDNRVRLLIQKISQLMSAVNLVVNNQTAETCHWVLIQGLWEFEFARWRDRRKWRSETPRCHHRSVAAGS